MERVTSIAAALVGVAMVAVLVQSPNTSRVLSAGGNAFANSVRAASGR